VLLESVTIRGFRSIGAELTILVDSPTILAGHNDAGKSAVLDAIAFLLDETKLTDRDRTYGAHRNRGCRSGLKPPASSSDRVM